MWAFWGTCGVLGLLGYIDCTQSLFYSVPQEKGLTQYVCSAYNAGDGEEEKIGREAGFYTHRGIYEQLLNLMAMIF